MPFGGMFSGPVSLWDGDRQVGLATPVCRRSPLILAPEALAGVGCHTPQAPGTVPPLPSLMPPAGSGWVGFPCETMDTITSSSPASPAIRLSAALCTQTCWTGAQAIIRHPDTAGTATLGSQEHLLGVCPKDPAAFGPQVSC